MSCFKPRHLKQTQTRLWLESETDTDSPLTGVWNRHTSLASDWSLKQIQTRLRLESETRHTSLASDWSLKELEDSESEATRRLIGNPTVCTSFHDLVTSKVAYHVESVHLSCFAVSCVRLNDWLNLFDFRVAFWCRLNVFPVEREVYLIHTNDLKIQGWKSSCDGSLQQVIWAKCIKYYYHRY